MGTGKLPSPIRYVTNTSKLIFVMEFGLRVLSWHYISTLFLTWCLTFFSTLCFDLFLDILTLFSTFRLCMMKKKKKPTSNLLFFWELRGRYWLLERPWTVKSDPHSNPLYVFTCCPMSSRNSYLVLRASDIMCNNFLAADKAAAALCLLGKLSVVITMRLRVSKCHFHACCKEPVPALIQLSAAQRKQSM